MALSATSDPIPRAGMRALCSFSGGKDSCLALWRAQRAGLDVRTLVAMFDEDGARSRSHAIPLALMQRQAEALALELVTRNAGWRNYEAVFTEALRELRTAGCQVAVFGDIDLVPHREWEERVCHAAELRAWLPLWQEDRRALAAEVIESGFRAVIVCTDARYLDGSYCGRQYDAQFLADLPPGVDACGENGEFHTFVYDGPNFRSPITYKIPGFDDYVAPPEYGSVQYRFARLA